MAEHTSFTETTTRKVYVLKSPTTWVEVEKVLSALRHEIPNGAQYDNTVTVEAYDDEVHFSYEVSTRRGTGTDEYLSIDPARLGRYGHVPSAQQYTAWAESLPPSEFATGVLTVAEALREREGGQG